MNSPIRDVEERKEYDKRFLEVQRRAEEHRDRGRVEEDSDAAEDGYDIVLTADFKRVKPRWPLNFWLSPLSLRLHTFVFHVW